MQLIDLTVPLGWRTVTLDWNLPVSPGHAPVSFTSIKRIAKGDASNVSTLPPRLRGGADIPLRIVGSGGAAPRVVLRTS